MALSPGRLQRVVWGALPGALYLGIRAVQELTAGAVWNGVSFAAMAVLVGSAPLLASGGAPKGRHAADEPTVLNLRERQAG
jgi:hypothetical protein